MYNRLKNTVLGIMFLTLTASVVAQSNNYWSWSFNTHSALLAGSVVGGSAGPSAIFYNPAFIDKENMPSLSLSTSMMSLQFYNIDNMAGDGIDANKMLFKIQPKFLSYVLSNKNDRLGIEVAILSPISEEIRYTIQHTDYIEIIQRTLGEEVYSGYLNYSRKYDDTWIGGGISYELSDRFSIGSSLFFSYKDLTYEYQQQAQANQLGDSVNVIGNVEPKYIAQSSFEEDLSYWYVSLIVKVGVQYTSKNERLSFGINITLPDIPLFGEADIRKSVTRSNVYNDFGETFTTNENILGVEDDNSDVRVKNPFSIAFGAQYFSKNKKSSFSFTLEYFHKIDDYALVNSSIQAEWLPKYISDNLSNDDFMSYYYYANSVINIALGFKQYLSPSLTYLGGFRTDFSANDIGNILFVDGRYGVNQVSMDKYHLTSGVLLKIKNFRLVGGIQYTYGRTSDMIQAVNYSNPVEYIPSTQQALEGIRQNNAQASLNEFALILGLSVGFN